MISFLFRLIRPFLLRLDPEFAHTITLKALASGLYPAQRRKDDPRLNQIIWGLHFSNPVGMAAGFDKNAEALQGLFDIGFGFVEAGTVTPRPQEGNPKPRIFREPQSRSVINRMGFPGKGCEAFAENYAEYRTSAREGGQIVGINIGKNKATMDPAADYIDLVGYFAPTASYIAINISSPNTPGLRDLQDPQFLKPFLEDIKKRRDNACGNRRKPPVLLKLSPDITDAQADALAATLLDAGIDGIILTNTTLDRPEKLPLAFRRQSGGLSGPYVRARSTALISRFYKATNGKIPIIGVGGIASAEDAYEKIRAGASLVQLYTALVYEGPGLVADIKKGLLQLLEKDGLRTLMEAVGKDSR